MGSRGGGSWPFPKDVLKIDCAAEAGEDRRLHRRTGPVHAPEGDRHRLERRRRFRAVRRAVRQGRRQGQGPGPAASGQGIEPAERRIRHEAGRSCSASKRSPSISRRSWTAFGTYEKRDAVAKAIYPEFGEGHKLKITLPSDILNKDGYNFFTLTTIDPQGTVKTTRLNNDQAQGIIAATCTKHRTRMMAQYYYSEKHNYLVCGTTNKSEAVQGLVRQIRGRRRGHRADRPSLQEPGLPVGRAPGRDPGDPPAARPARTPTAPRSRTRSGSSACPSRRWTCCSMPGRTRSISPRSAGSWS